MHPRSTLVLLVVFAVLVGVLVYTRRTAGTDPTPTEPASGGLLWESLNSADIVGIKLTDHIAEQTVELRNNQGVWDVILPASALADPNQAASAASQLAGLSVTRTITETIDLSEFGVLEPRYTFEVTKVNGETLAVDIGKKTPVAGGYYALRRGESNAVIVTGFTVDALTPLIGAPPYQPTPTPTINPLEELPGPVVTAPPSGTP